MSTHSHQQLATYAPWMAQIADAANKTTGLPDGVTVTENFVLDFADDVPNEKIFDLAVRFAGLDRKMGFHATVLRYNVGRMILELCARTGQTEDQVIIDCGLCERTGRSVKTLCNWSGIVSRLPPSLLKPGVCWSALAVMGDIRVPDDPKLLLELRSEQERVLDMAAADPEECNTSFVRKEMKTVLEKLGMKPQAGPSRFDLLLEYAVLLRKLRFAEEHDDDYEAVGFSARGDLVNAIESVEASLINLAVLSASVEEVK